MSLATLILTILGLALFEVVNSIDNAIINAEVLATMGKPARRWFLVWGIFIAVFLVRGLLPWLIFWGAVPSLGPVGALTAAFSSDPAVLGAVEAASPILLVAGGSFLLFLFLHWIFMEEKHYGLPGERYVHSKAVWFYASVSVLLLVLVWLSLKHDPLMALGASIGSTVFFVTHGLKQTAEEEERRLTEGKDSKRSDKSKVFYLEMIDAVFSIDGVLGAFAFTLSVPLIVLGNGLGAIVVRQLTMGNIETIKKYKYLKNGAMYAILALGAIMVTDSFGVHVPEWVSPLLTMGIIGFFFWKSKRELSAGQVAKS